MQNFPEDSPGLGLASFLKNQLMFIWPHLVSCGILVPQSGIKLTPSALEAQSLNHWTTSPELLFFVVLFNDIVLVIIPSMQKANTFLSGY